MDNLTREELLELVERQQKQLDKLLNPPPNDWHSWFYSLLMIKMYKYFPAVSVEREVLLGAQPPRADFIVLKESQKIDLELGVFRIFRKHNILEFKSPDDELNKAVLWKVIGYAGMYISARKIDENSVTLTLLRGAKPIKLFQELGEAIRPDPDTRGVYHICEWFIKMPIQIIVTTELEGQEYAGFRAISKQPDIEDVWELLFEAEGSKQEAKDYYRDYIELLTKFDREVMKIVSRRAMDMDTKRYPNLMELLKPEMDACREEAEERMGKLIVMLVSAGRNDDVIAAATDPQRRVLLYKEFKLTDDDEEE